MGVVVDLKAVSESLAALDRLAEQHPELTGQSSMEDWMETLEQTIGQPEKRKPTVLERQLEHMKKREAAGDRKFGVWVRQEYAGPLRERFAGPRGGIDWDKVIQAALGKGRRKPKAAP